MAEVVQNSSGVSILEGTLKSSVHGPGQLAPV